MCVWERERELYTRVLAHLAGAKCAGTRCPREWFLEIRLLALQGRNFLLLFYFLVAWLLCLRDMEGLVGFLISLRIRLRREVVGSPIYTTDRLPPKYI